MTAGDSLREWLDATQWTQAKLARRCGVSPAAMSRFISGSRPIGRPFAIAIEQVMTDAYRRGDVATQPLRAIDIEDVTKHERQTGTG